MELADSVMVHLDDEEFRFYRADVEHLGGAVELLRRQHRYTAAERLVVIRKWLEASLCDQ